MGLANSHFGLGGCGCCGCIKGGDVYWFDDFSSYTSGQDLLPLQYAIQGSAGIVREVNGGIQARNLGFGIRDIIARAFQFDPEFNQSASAQFFFRDYGIPLLNEYEPDLHICMFGILNQTNFGWDEGGFSWGLAYIPLQVPVIKAVRYQWTSSTGQRIHRFVKHEWQQGSTLKMTFDKIDHYPADGLQSETHTTIKGDVKFYLNGVLFGEEVHHTTRKNVLQRGVTIEASFRGHGSFCDNRYCIGTMLYTGESQFPNGNNFGTISDDWLFELT